MSIGVEALFATALGLKAPGGLFNLRWLTRAMRRGWIRRHFVALFAWLAVQLHGSRSAALGMRT